jgi:hypothetical protein
MESDSIGFDIFRGDDKRCSEYRSLYQHKQFSHRNTRRVLFGVCQLRGDHHWIANEYARFYFRIIITVPEPNVWYTAYVPFHSI